MREWRLYRCDFGHSWTIRKDTSDPEASDDIVCAEGHEAVTCQKQVANDEVSFIFESAARIVDPATGRVGGAERWDLVVIDREGQEIARTPEPASWDTIVRYAAALKGKDPLRARDWAARLFKSPAGVVVR